MMYKDEGGNAVDGDLSGEDVLGINNDNDEEKAEINENVDNSNNIPPQAIPPSDE